MISQDIFLKNYNEINQILQRLFENQFSRFSQPPAKENFSPQSYELACSIYKRGFQNKEFPQIKFPQNETLQILNKVDFVSLCKERVRQESFFLVDHIFLQNHPDLQNCFDNQCITYQAHESTKNMETLHHILKSIPSSAKRVFALGGGITLDIGGFVAGLCSLPVDYLCTTFLSAVDAGVGGKTGVNFPPYGKNQVGLFNFPENIYFVPEFLQTLSHEQWACGVVEALKHAHLFGEVDADLPLLEKILEGPLPWQDLERLVQKNFQYKSSIVKADPFETKRLRSVLNLGHTVGHVLESLSESDAIKPLSHGLAVAHGLYFLHEKNLLHFNARILDLLIRLNKSYPIQSRKIISHTEIKQLFSHDKKNQQKDFCSLILVPEGELKESIKKENWSQQFSIDWIAVQLKEYLKFQG